MTALDRAVYECWEGAGSFHLPFLSVSTDASHLFLLTIPDKETWFRTAVLETGENVVHFEIISENKWEDRWEEKTILSVKLISFMGSLRGL